VAYSPLGIGLLTGRLIEAVATAKSCTSGQIALAWVIGGGEHILALTGTTKLENLKANLGACDVELSNNERITLDALAARVMGDRYDTWGMAGING
jgi:aryl-alcohol dehydrogenase-like predicted oxidoreductase